MQECDKALCDRNITKLGGSRTHVTDNNMLGVALVLGIGVVYVKSQGIVSGNSGGYVRSPHLTIRYYKILYKIS